MAELFRVPLRLAKDGWWEDWNGSAFESSSGLRKVIDLPDKVKRIDLVVHDRPSQDRPSQDRFVFIVVSNDDAGFWLQMTDEWKPLFSIFLNGVEGGLKKCRAECGDRVHVQFEY